MTIARRSMVLGGVVLTMFSACVATETEDATREGQIVEPGAPGAADVTLAVRSDRAVRPISRLIYGANTRPEARTRYTLMRAGGNRWTAYNWENNASNAGSDWLYQNDAHLSASNTPGQAVRDHINAAAAIGAASLVTVPIVDYVAADKNGGGDIRNTPNYTTTRLKQNRARKGLTFTTTPSTSDAHVYQDEFTSWLKGAYPTQSIFFSLDNEPDLWAETHPEVHPNAVGYDELCNRNVEYAKAIKGVWPDRKVLGFVSYGWYGFTALQGAPDRAGKGEFIDYYLSKMRAAEVANGIRLVDYLDLHWYPEAQGATSSTRITGTSTAADVVEARVQAPRSLWDTTYREKSWITDVLGGPINLLPREQAKINAGYPGTGLAITEWNYGGGAHISGAIASADVLGIFGREGVQIANMWELNGDESYTRAAFEAYRNYDGAGASFGDTAISATSSDVAAASVHASIDSTDRSRVVIVAINKRTSARAAAITLAHDFTYGNAAVYTITAAGGARLVRGADLVAVATNAYRYAMPAHSVTVIVPTRTSAPVDAGTDTATSDAAKYNFESSQQGWASSGAIFTSLTTSSTRAFAGTRSLAVQFSGTAGTGSVRASAPAAPAGARITFRVFIPAGSSITAVQPYVMDRNWAWTGAWTAAASLVKGSWNTISLTVPAGAALSLSEIGVQFQANAGWTGTAYIDSVTW